MTKQLIFGQQPMILEDCKITLQERSRDNIYRKLLLPNYVPACLRCGGLDHTREVCLKFKTKPCANPQPCPFGASCWFAHPEETRRSPLELRCIHATLSTNSSENTKLLTLYGCNGAHAFSQCPRNRRRRRQQKRNKL